MEVKHQKTKLLQKGIKARRSKTKQVQEEDFCKKQQLPKKLHQLKPSHPNCLLKNSQLNLTHQSQYLLLQAKLIHKMKLNQETSPLL